MQAGWVAGAQIIQDANVVSIFDQAVGQSSSDEPRAAGNQATHVSPRCK
jgi:hypothetical protein